MDISTAADPLHACTYRHVTTMAYDVVMHCQSTVHTPGRLAVAKPPGCTCTAASIPTHL